MAFDNFDGGTRIMTNEYDEDLSQNTFYKTLLQNYVDLFNQCVQEKWLICVPRMDSLPNYTFTLEDFKYHILKPLNPCQELKSRYLPNFPDDSCSSRASSIPTISRDSSFNNLNTITGSSFTGTSLIEASQRKWNFCTLVGVNIEYMEKTLFIDTGDVDRLNDDLQSQRNNPRFVSVLFDETFYTPDKQKYKVLCISRPLNSQMEPGNGYYYNMDESNSLMWNLGSLRDCIDFLWVNGRPKTLETFDAYIRLFLHNHRSLEDLPLPVQRDLVYDLYKKCLSYTLKSDPKHKRLKSTTSQEQYSSTDTIHSSESTRSNHTTQNFQLATETYILNGIYRQLIAAITSTVSFEDSSVNKIMRNVAEIHPQDLGISNIHWETLSRARQELGRLPMHFTPLGKLNCLRKTMKYLKQQDNELESVDDENGIISTDDLLPIWVYLIVKTPIGNWMGQLQFLRQFRFSAIDTPDNESSFFIVTLEASLLFLNSGKISGVLSESERDVGTPYQDYVGEFWLRSLFISTEDDESIFGEMMATIRHGNLEKLGHLINDYESERKNEEDKSKFNPLDDSKLCHPLCNCTNCVELIRPKVQLKIPSVFELSNEDCGLTLLHVACIYGRPKIVDFMLGTGAPSDIQDSQGRYAIHYAASRGHQNALLLLLHSGCPIDPRDHSLNTPLILASMNGHESVVKALIYYAEHSKQKLDISAVNCNGDSSLHFASRYGFLGIVQLLVESGASITFPNARQRNPLDVAHDVHVTRILHRSLRRRSLIQSNHGDFVNVEVMAKGDSEGILLFISDPTIHPFTPTSPEQDDGKNVDASSGISKSRRSSGSSNPTTSGVITRKTSSVVTPSFIPTIREGEVEEIFNTKSRKKRSVYNPEETKVESVDEMVFHISNVVPVVQPEVEHLRKVSVYNLEHAPHVLAEMALLGTKRRKDYEERGFRKLFSAIECGDIPLALFYLGIPSEELEKAETIEPGNSSEFDKCHPLCPCARCAAKSAGLLQKLGLDINVVSSTGLTFLQLAVIHNNHSLVKILLKYGADINKRSTNGKTSLEYAKERYYEDIALTLQLWKAVSHKDPDVPFQTKTHSFGD